MDDAPFSRPRIGIIGGRGAMGRWLESAFLQTGHQVEIADLADGPLGPARVAAWPVTVLAVPVPAVPQVMAAIGPHTRPDGVVLDVASLKAGPLKAMLAQARGEVIGCHPLFGPSAPSLAGQTVFICPGRGRRWLDWLRAWLRRGGAVVQEIEPERHDRLMAQVQSLRHLLLAGLGLALQDTGFDPARDLALAGPWFQALAGLIDQQARQPAALYADLALNNLEAPRMLEALIEALQGLARALESGDRPALMTGLERAGRLLDRAGGEKDLDGPSAEVYCIQNFKGTGR